MLAFPFARCLAFAALALAGLSGCGGAYLPGRTAGFDADGATQIDDEDIRKAFEARPQLPGAVRVAYYSFDPLIAKDVEAALATLPGVTSVYPIPALLVTGQRRIEEMNGSGSGRDVTVKKLRLLAARAHADALVVVDHGYRTGGANGLAALNVLVLPIFFVPFLDNRIDGYAQAFLIDVRNGYLYGQVSEDDRRGPAFATLYSPSAGAIAAEQWKALDASMRRDLASLMATEHAHSRSEGPAALAAKPADRQGHD